MSSLVVPEGPWSVFLQQGIRFTEIWHIMWFFVSSYTDTQQTQGPID